MPIISLHGSYNDVEPSEGAFADHTRGRTMTQLSRRNVLRAAGLLAGAAALAACDTAPKGGAESQGSGRLKWWDHFQPLSDVEKELFATFARTKGGVPVDYTVYNPNEQGKALQLAKQSNQLPDVFTLAGVSLPAPTLVNLGWFSPIELSDEAKKRLPDGTLLEGVTTFDGKIYSFPQFNFRQYATLTWFNTDLFGKAGLDPNSPPKTYDEFRSAARAIKQKGGGGVFGWIAPLKFTDRMSTHVTELAQAAGYAGAAELNEQVDFRTGAYAFHTDPFVTAIEFLLSLKKDGLLFPSSSSLDARTGRARWATGTAGFFFDGPWNIGVVVDSFKPFADKVGVGPVLVPNGGAKPTLHQVQQPPTFWVSKDSQQVEAASRLLSMILEPDYQAKLAENMDQPPLDLTAVDRADVHDTYRKALQIYQDEVFLAPSPAVKNPGVAAVRAEMKPIHPNLGEIVQGAFSGDIPDVRGALKQLSDKSEAERERAIGVVGQKGTKVSVDDWRFPAWQPGKDFGAKLYK
ncbi:ABC transporter substrate-binding protein [Micromonospora sp. NPDC005299]|uniref:ABC transporter substrate-binding protein n=1 Tax=Micromonospora sp. NPDC005299 TaxID=3364231 RepID=UPI00368F417E